MSIVIQDNEVTSLTSSGNVSLEERASLLAEKYSSNYKVNRDSSVDDLGPIQ